MLIAPIVELFQKDLLLLKKEIESYQNQDRLWVIDADIKNSGGNLCLHLVGNLKTYIGNGLGEIGYIRQRDLEFSAKGIDRSVLYAQIEETINIVSRSIGGLTPEQLDEPFPMMIWGKEMSTGYTLIRLHAHLNYHLGQINYHRRMLDS